MESNFFFHHDRYRFSKYIRQVALDFINSLYLSGDDRRGDGKQGKLHPRSPTQENRERRPLNRVKALDDQGPDTIYVAPDGENGRGLGKRVLTQGEVSSLALSTRLPANRFFFGTGEGSPGDEVVSVDVSKIILGKPVVMRMHTNQKALARRLGLDIAGVRKVIEHRGAEDLICYSQKITKEDVAAYQRATGGDERKARMLAVFSHIVLSNPQAGLQELQDYSTAVGLPLKFNHKYQMLTVGENELIGIGAHATVKKVFMVVRKETSQPEVLGWVARKRTMRKLTAEEQEARGRGELSDATAVSLRRRLMAEDILTARREAEMGLLLKDVPFVNRTHLCRSAAGAAVIVSELCEYGELFNNEDLINENMSPREKWTLFWQILRGIQGMHDLGVVHNDIKPDNILLTFCDGDLQPRISDLGYAQRMPGTTVRFQGTYPYIPPEEWKALQDGAVELPFTPARDAFSAGVVALLVFLRITPTWYVDSLEDVAKLMPAALLALPKQIDDRCAAMGLPREIAEAIKILTHSDPNQRQIPVAMSLLATGINTHFIS